MQEACLAAADGAGARVYRGALAGGLTVTSKPGMLPELEFEAGGHSQKMSTRIVGGADGRDSSIPAWSGLSMQQDPDRNLVAGVLLESLEHSEDTTHV